MLKKWFSASIAAALAVCTQTQAQEKVLPKISVPQPVVVNSAPSAAPAAPVMSAPVTSSILPDSAV